MKQQLVSLITIICFVFCSFPTNAQDLKLVPPRLTGIEKGEAAPFDGVLLNMSAAAQLFVENTDKNKLLECNLKLDKGLELQKAEYDLKLNILQVHLDAVDQKYKEILIIKNAEIDDLYETLKKNQGGDYHEFWLAGGVLVGIATSILIFYAAVEVQK